MSADPPPAQGDAAVDVGEHHDGDDEIPEVIRGKKLPADFLEDSLRDRVRDAKLISELVVYIPFLTLFLLFTLLVLNIENGHFAIANLKKLTLLSDFPKPNVINRTVYTAYKTGGLAAVSLDPDNYWSSIGVLANWNDWITMTFQNLWRCTDSELPYQSAAEAQIMDPNDILAAACAKPKGNTSNATNFTTFAACIAGSNSAPPGFNPLIGDVTKLQDRGWLPQFLRAQTVPIGSLRLRTQRVTNQSCGVAGYVKGPSAIFDPNLNQTVDVTAPCYASTVDSSTELRISPLCYKINPLDPFGPPLFQYKACSLSEGSPITTELGTYTCGGYTLDVPWNLTCADALRVVYQLTEPSCPFVDPTATRLAVVEYFAYSVNYDLYVSVKHILEITSGGAFIVSDQFRPFVLLNSSRTGLLVLDFIFLTFVCYYIVMFFVEWRRFAKAEGRILRYLLNIWVILELANVCTYLTVFILRWIWWAESIAYMSSLPAAAYPNDLETILLIFSSMRYAIAVNFVLTFMKIIKYLKISDRLAVISNTFERAQADVLGLLVIFVFIVLGFAVSGNALFGTRLWGFASLDRSISTLMFMLLGQLDYESMKAVNPTLAGLYFWSYLILAFFLVLNFIVAVIGDSFSESAAEKYVPPLAEAVSDTANNFVWALRPTVISAKAKLMCAGKSADGLEQQMLGYIAQGHSRLKLTAGGAQVMLLPQDVLKWFPSSLRRDGHLFFCRFWENFIESYARLMMTDDAQAEAERRNAIITGTRAALGALTIDRVRSTMSQIDSLNRTSNALIDALNERGFAAGSPKKADVQ